MSTHDQRNNGSDAKNAPRGHSFDGIEEYDNDLPRWWVGLFLATMVFAGGYMAWYHMPGTNAKTLAGELNLALDARQAEVQAQRAAQAAQSPSGTASGSASAFDYASALKDQALVARGKETFVALCQACHGPEGQGSVGPNLTDDFWLHGASYANVEATVSNGVPDKGMPAWGPTLGMDTVHAVVTYVRSIQHTNPANPKAPQGEPGVMP